MRTSLSSNGKARIIEQGMSLIMGITSTLTQVFAIMLRENSFYSFYLDMKYYKIVHTNGMHILGRRAVSPYHWTIFIEVNKDRSR
jgi:hypothetical protein